MAAAEKSGLLGRNPFAGPGQTPVPKPKQAAAAAKRSKPRPSAPAPAAAPQPRPKAARTRVPKPRSAQPAATPKAAPRKAVRSAPAPTAQGAPAPQPIPAKAEVVAPLPAPADSREFLAEIGGRVASSLRTDSENMEKQVLERELQRYHTELQKMLQRLRQLPIPEESPHKTLFHQFADLMEPVVRLYNPKTYLDFWFETVLAARSPTTDPFGYDPLFEERINPLFEFLYRRWWRVGVEGVEHIPANIGTLLVSNHSGMLPYDGTMIKQAVKNEHPAHRHVRFLVENFIFYFPFLGPAVYRYGGVRACQENAEMLLRHQKLVAVFPEGVKGIGKLYRDRYQLQRFGRGGFIKLAMRTGAPIVPVAVIGAEEIHPMVARADFLSRPLRVPYVPITPTFPLLGPLGLIPLPSKWKIVFGPPVPIGADYGPDAANDEILVNHLSLRVRKIIEDMIYEALRQRKSVYLG